MKHINKVLIFGSLPPPTGGGGVHKSIENLVNSLRSKGVFVRLVSIKSLFTTYDVSHINYRVRWKIVLGVIIARIVSNRVLLTYHGVDFYPNKNFVDKLILKLIDGLIVLNNVIYERCSMHSHKVCLLTPVFSEGIDTKLLTNSNALFTRERNKIYLLLYAYDKIFKRGIEVYGVLFILDLLKDLPSEYCLILVDPKSGYIDDVNHFDLKNRLIYINYYVNMLDLLQYIDIYIRPTNFDGNSIVTIEALLSGKQVLASNAVDRQNGIVVYNNNDSASFLEKLKAISDGGSSKGLAPAISSIDDYLDFCNSLL